MPDPKRTEARCGTCGGMRGVSGGLITFHEAANTDEDGVHDECPGTGRPAALCDCPPADWQSCPHCGRPGDQDHKDRCHRAAVGGDDGR